MAGFHRGASSTNGGWCNNTILIPYTGDERSIKDGGFLEAENWGEPTVLEGAAFDVTYFEREENGKAQGCRPIQRSTEVIGMMIGGTRGCWSKQK